MAQEQKSEQFDLAEAARRLEKQRSGIVLSGQIKDGKVVLDKRTRDAIAKSFAGANRSFVAVNAPFDPNSQAV